jgi:hypothetical protein
MDVSLSDASGDPERQRLVEELLAKGRRDAAAWLALLRYDYAAVKKAPSREAWSRLAAAYRGPAALPTDQRRTEAFALIQVDEARIKM